MSVSPDDVKSVLALGAESRGTGWDATKAAKAVRKLTGLAMVTTNFQEYLKSFLFSLCLCAGLRIPALDLSDRASEVAFGLSERWQALGEDLESTSKQGQPKKLPSTRSSGACASEVLEDGF